MDKTFNLDDLLKQQARKYKSKPIQFASVEGGVKNRLEKNVKLRKSTRSTVFDGSRSFPKYESPGQKNRNPVSEKLESRKQKLMKWKIEKEQRKKEEAEHKKKPFVVGISHPPLGYVPPPPVLWQGKIMRSTSGQVTRSQSAENTKNSSKPKAESSFAAMKTQFGPPQINNMPEFPKLAPVTKETRKNNTTTSFEPVLPKSQKPDANKRIPVITEKTSKPVPKTLVETTRTRRKTINDLKSKGEILLPQKPKLESTLVETSTSTRDIELTDSSKISSPEEKLCLPKNVTDSPMTPEQIVEENNNISPCVMMSRGKSNAKKEVKKKIEDGLLDQEASCESVEYFRRQLTTETARISALCDLWDEVLHSTCLPDHAQEAVLSAVGLARLLLAQKFQQFAGLLERCEKPDGFGPQIHPSDLLGFWEMLFLQVVNVDMRFKNLEVLRSWGWQEAHVESYLQRKVGKGRKVEKPAATGLMKKVIAAARKAMKKPPQLTQEYKTFEAGFFVVRSPVRVHSTPCSNGLLNAVLSNEMNKASESKNSASMAMLRASMISKNMDGDSELNSASMAMLRASMISKNMDGDSELFSSYRSANQTPINLSKINVVKSGKKSIKLDLYNAWDTEQNTSNNDLNASNKKVPDITLSEVQNIDSRIETENDHRSVKRRSKLVRQEATD